MDRKILENKIRADYHENEALKHEEGSASRYHHLGHYHGYMARVAELSGDNYNRYQHIKKRASFIVAANKRIDFLQGQGKELNESNQNLKGFLQFLNEGEYENLPAEEKFDWEADNYREGSEEHNHYMFMHHGKMVDEMSPEVDGFMTGPRYDQYKNHLNKMNYYAMLIKHQRNTRPN